MLAPEKYDALLKTVDRDCKVLQSFGIMDYSLLVGIHNMDLIIREKTGVSLKISIYMWIYRSGSIWYEGEWVHFPDHEAHN